MPERVTGPPGADRLVAFAAQGVNRVVARAGQARGQAAHGGVAGALRWCRLMIFRASRRRFPARSAAHRPSRDYAYTGCHANRYAPLCIAPDRFPHILAGGGRFTLQCMADVPEWDPDAGGPGYTYAKVADHVAARIAAGELAAGAMLPGEREMAAGYGVAVATVRRAVKELRERGLVTTLPAKGTFIILQPDKHTGDRCPLDHSTSAA